MYKLKYIKKKINKKKIKKNKYEKKKKKKFRWNTQYKGGIKNNNSNKNNNSISYRNKLKEGKVVSSLTNNLQKKF